MIVLFTVANQPNYISGYNYFAGTYFAGLPVVVATLAGGTLPPTPTLLYNAIYSYIQPLYYVSGDLTTDQLQKINATLGNHFNAYLGPENPAWAFYNSRQMEVINDVINTLNALPVNVLAEGNWLAVLGEKLTVGCLSVQEQAPLMIGLTLAASALSYFYPQIKSPSANWAVFFDTNQAVNFMNLSSWAVATFVGSLIGATQSIPEVPTTADDAAGIGDNLITINTSALTATFARIIFQWEQRPPMLRNCIC